MKFSIRTLTAIALFSFSSVSVANTVIFDAKTDPSLLGVDGILDSRYGLENLQRIDDINDEYWSAAASDMSFEVVAKHVKKKLTFGFTTADGSFNALTTVKKLKANKPKAGTFSAVDTGNKFRFSLDPKGKLFFTSDNEDNVFCNKKGKCKGPYDQMVTWLITDGEHAGDYVVAWENGKKQGDKDFNDFVVRISGAQNMNEVPVPAAVWLMVSGILGLVGVARKK